MAVELGDGMRRDRGSVVRGELGLPRVAGSAGFPRAGGSFVVGRSDGLSVT